MAVEVAIFLFSIGIKFPYLCFMDEDKIIEDLIQKGIIGVSLGKLLFENKGEGAVLGALAGAAILATYKAHQDAIKTGIPLIIKENGKLYKLEGGKKTFIKNLLKPIKKYQRHLKMK